ncbi:MAG: hypothetical protein H6R18_426 [Proteobacteria bacterium]|nr:hypothetical protein [Pseudomonadota bacterium]
MNLLSADEIRVLTEVGFVAAGRGDVQRAERIFSALQRLRPHRAFAYIGQAMAYMNTGRSEDSAKILGHAVGSVDPDERAEIEAFRGLALQLAGRTSESLRALRAAASSSSLAQAMLGESEAACSR